jgi:hypothetical protein
MSRKTLKRIMMGIGTVIPVVQIATGHFPV